MLRELMHVYSPPSPEEMAQEELDQAQRELLKAQSAREYAASMVQYHTQRIERLQAYLRKTEESPTPTELLLFP